MSILLEIEKGESRKLEFKEMLLESSKISKTVVAFSNGAGGKLIIGVNDDGELNEENLINLKLIREENGNKYCTKALILLTDNKFFEYAKVRCARFKGNDIGEFIDQKEFNSPLYEQVENCMTLAKNHINKSGKIT